MYVSAVFTRSHFHRDPISYGGELTRLAGMVKKSATALAEDFSVRRLDGIEVPSQLAHHPSRLQPRSSMRRECRRKTFIPS